MADRFTRSPPDAETVAMRLLLLLTAFALTACGQSGALVLPDAKTEATPAAAPAPAAEEKKEEDAPPAATTPAQAAP
jgi:predicted small lipoprotein YifL